ncbi:MAG: response regulator [Agathobacter sp.]
MERYKVLLAGKNSIIKDDFFQYMNDVFITMTTSMRNYDIKNHLEIFQPNIFVYCLNDDKREDILHLLEYRKKMDSAGVIPVIIGTEEECDNFEGIAINMAKLVLKKPISANAIKEQILKYMKKLEEIRAEERSRQEELVRMREEKSRKHVLVIDDDPLMLKMIKEQLHDQYDVATAISGKIAYKFLETKKTNLILLDYEMPVEDGPEVFHKIKENKELAEIPIIFLTGVSNKDKIKQALMLKPQGYLLKPIEREKLLKTIEEFIK